MTELGMQIVYLILLMIGALLILSVYSGYYAIKLNFYLKKKYPKRHREIQNTGFQLDKIFKKSYLSSNLDEKDKNIRIFKNKLRLSGKIGLVMVCIMLILIILLFIDLRII